MLGCLVPPHSHPRPSIAWMPETWLGPMRCCMHTSRSRRQRVGRQLDRGLKGRCCCLGSSTTTLHHALNPGWVKQARAVRGQPMRSIRAGHLALHLSHTTPHTAADTHATGSCFVSSITTTTNQHTRAHARTHARTRADDLWIFLQSSIYWL